MFQYSYIGLHEDTKQGSITNQLESLQIFIIEYTTLLNIVMEPTTTEVYSLSSHLDNQIEEVHKHVRDKERQVRKQFQTEIGKHESMFTFFKFVKVDVKNQ